MDVELINRPRRLRLCATMRKMVKETRCAPSQLIFPIFVRDGAGVTEPIKSMPGQMRYSVDMLAPVLDRACEAGISGVLFFGVPDSKDECGSGAWDKNGAVQRAVSLTKKKFGDMLLAVTDVCMCEYTSHGHCGVLSGGADYVDNDATLELLAKAALSHAAAGADIVAPSDMMDGRVGRIRAELDRNGFANTSIMSYSAKYASAFYGPFREAAGSTPMHGDRKTYQMDPHNGREAVKEAILDYEEGADILMVKPALPYLDIISALRRDSLAPVAAYQVSGEYSMIKAAGAAGFLDEHAVMNECALSIIRAGADIVITYFAFELSESMKNGEI
ncbi:MAG: porphobilinogen synthase [Oscillospiraceae bacterium]|nr:porphobilinogen synthase [Oscillospiraceae bacterium]